MTQCLDSSPSVGEWHWRQHRCRRRRRRLRHHRIVWSHKHTNIWRKFKGNKEEKSSEFSRAIGTRYAKPCSQTQRSTYTHTVCHSCSAFIYLYSVVAFLFFRDSLFKYYFFGTKASSIIVHICGSMVCIDGRDWRASMMRRRDNRFQFPEHIAVDLFNIQLTVWLLSPLCPSHTFSYW